MKTSNDFVIRKGVLKEYKGPGGIVVIPEGVTSIGECMLWGDNTIDSLILPDSLKRIEAFVFPDLELESIIIPRNVETIDEIIVQKSIEVNPDNPFFSSKDGVLFDKNITRLISCPVKKKGEYVIPDSVQEIGDSAFCMCADLRRIVIPESVTTVGWAAFLGCTGLSEITFPASVSNLGRNVLDQCTDLRRITIQGNLAEAMPASENRLNIQSVTVPHWTSAVTQFLSSCIIEEIKTDDFSAVPTKYRPMAALGFIAKAVGMADTEEASKYESYLIKYAVKLCSFAFDHPELLLYLLEHQLISAKDIDVYLVEAEKRENTENKAMLLEYQNKLGTKTVTRFREKKEKAKEEYEDVMVERMNGHDPSKGIEGMTFVIAGKLNPSTWHYGVWRSTKEVQEYLASYGAKLGSSVTKQTDYLVTNNTDRKTGKEIKAAELGVPIITEFEFNELIGKRFSSWKSFSELFSNRFSGTPQIKVPAWLKKLHPSAFFDNKTVENVTISDGIVSIGSWAFEKCEKLKTVTIPESVTNIERGAFSGCLNLTIHAPAGSYAEQYAKENNIPFVAE